MHSFPRRRSSYRDLFASAFSWEAWESVIEANGYTIERPAHEPHPEYPGIVYPIDYGFVNGTLSSDGEAVDCFVGSASPDGAARGLVGTILTTDHRKGDREVKLLYRCTPREIYTAHGFINFDRTLLEGLLVLRRPMHDLWERCGA